MRPAVPSLLLRPLLVALIAASALALLAGAHAARERRLAAAKAATRHVAPRQDGIGPRPGVARPP